MRRVAALLLVPLTLLVCRAASIRPTIENASGHYCAVDSHSSSSLASLGSSSLLMGLDLDDDGTFRARWHADWGPRP